MTDIRPIREAESERFLKLLCEVFHLDFNRAFDIFFSEPFYDLQHKWALFEGPDMVSILTTSPLWFGWGPAIGIAGVATRKDLEGEGHASRLIQRVLRENEKKGVAGALLFAKDVRLYEKNGFEALDRVARAKIRTRPEADAPVVASREVRVKYDAWADLHPDRLRRDAKRWEYWDWHYRTCTEFQDGYLCHEVSVLREALFATPEEALPLPEGAEWYGTTFMADQLELPLEELKVDMYLMGRGIPGIPQMFMTDQF